MYSYRELKAELAATANYLLQKAEAPTLQRAVKEKEDCTVNLYSLKEDMTLQLQLVRNKEESEMGSVRVAEEGIAPVRAAALGDQDVALKNLTDSATSGLKCQDSSKIFKVKGSLDAHRRDMHSGAPVYSCLACGKKFGCRHDLKVTLAWLINLI